MVALGSETNFFGMADVEKNAYTMKTLNDAILLRNRVIDMLEQAENETDPILRKGMLNFVVVGGGYAGIETAGELLDLLFDATKHYPTIQKEDVKVIVLEATKNTLEPFKDFVNPTTFVSRFNVNRMLRSRNMTAQEQAAG